MVGAGLNYASTVRVCIFTCECWMRKIFLSAGSLPSWHISPLDTVWSMKGESLGPSQAPRVLQALRKHGMTFNLGIRGGGSSWRPAASYASTFPSIDVLFSIIICFLSI